jgi:hypothetical protein
MRIPAVLVLALLTACVSAENRDDALPRVTVLSWNVSGVALDAGRDGFKSLMSYADPDLLLLDEVSPRTGIEGVQKALPDGQTFTGDAAPGDPWHVSYGPSGGRQRGVIASRYPIEELAEFARILPYPDDAKRLMIERMTAKDRRIHEPRLEDGVAANGAIVLAGSKRLLVVVADLECCGNDPGSWAELKRRVEAKIIRGVVDEVLERTAVDAIILAGDFNLVSTAIPMALLSGPYRLPHSGLIAAELYHRDGMTTWTWDGRGTPFPSRALDYQLYSPATLRVEGGVILDTEDMDADELEQHGFTQKMMTGLSGHRPLLVEYAWR